MLSAYGSYAVAFDNIVGKVTCGQKPVSNGKRLRDSI